MPRALFGFDGDNAYYEALREKVLADRDADQAVEKERRKSLGLPEEEKRAWYRRSSKATMDNDALKLPRGDVKLAPDMDKYKKSTGEKLANVLFNAGRRAKQDDV